MPHDFFKLKPPELYRNVQELFCEVKKLFFAEVWKMPECHFWADVMLRQPHVRASRASPAQKWPGLRVVYSKTFMLHFLFSGPLRLSIYIWAICQWNKFDGKTQCETEIKCSSLCFVKRQFVFASFINLLEILVDFYLNYCLSLDVCACFHGSVCGSVCPKKIFLMFANIKKC